MTIIPFTEIFDNLPGKGLDLDVWNSYNEGCKCKHNDKSVLDNCCFEIKDQSARFDESDQLCTCIQSNKFNRNNYTECGRLNIDYREENWYENTYPINECNLECECDEETCKNRLVQNGCRFNLEVIDCGNKGKGVRTNEFIPMGSFVADYLGELIGIDVAKTLLTERTALKEPNYIMILREFYKNHEQMTLIDARNYSNISRYINHLCEPNLLIVPVRINNILPHAALFAIRDIKIGEELGYNYFQTYGCLDNKEINHEYSSSDSICLCKADNCNGFLPKFYL